MSNSNSSKGIKVLSMKLVSKVKPSFYNFTRIVFGYSWLRIQFRCLKLAHERIVEAKGFKATSTKSNFSQSFLFHAFYHENSVTQ